MKKTLLALFVMVLMACVQTVLAEAPGYIIPYISVSDEPPLPEGAAKNQMEEKERWGLLNPPMQLVQDCQIEDDGKHAYLCIANRWYLMDWVSVQFLLNTACSSIQSESTAPDATLTMQEPTVVPILFYSPEPVAASSPAPTEKPTAVPIVRPTMEPTPRPTLVFTEKPTKPPMNVRTPVPTAQAPVDILGNLGGTRIPD